MPRNLNWQRYVLKVILCYEVMFRVKVKVTSLSRVRLFATPWTIQSIILQARILEWVTFPFSKGSSQPGDWTQVSCIAGGFFTSWATRAPQEYWSGYSLSLLQLIFLAQESNQDLLHCRWILYQLSYEGLIIIALQEMDKDLWRKKTWPWLKWKCLITLISELSFSIKESQSEIKHIYYHNRKFIFS